LTCIPPWLPQQRKVQGRKLRGVFLKNAVPSFGRAMANNQTKQLRHAFAPAETPRQKSATER
jgi:hypothetical protein